MTQIASFPPSERTPPGGLSDADVARQRDAGLVNGREERLGASYALTWVLVLSGLWLIVYAVPPIR